MHIDNVNFNIGDMSIIVKMRFGSHLYGTVTKDSDEDWKGVYLPDKEKLYLGNVKKSIKFDIKQSHGIKNTQGDIDIELYSLHYFIKLACEGQTVALDMLHAPDNMIDVTSYIWKEIVANKQRFFTKDLKAFIGYSRKQAAKYGIKGSRLDSLKKVSEFLNSVIGDSIYEGTEDKVTMKDVWDELPEGEHISKSLNEKHGLREYEVCGKKTQETAKVVYAVEIFNRYYQEFGQRAEKARKNEGIDWKAISHAIRAAIEVKQIYTEGTITFPLKEAEYLAEVKQGNLDYLTEVAPKLEAMVDEVTILAEESRYPNRADVRFWNNFIIKTLDENLPDVYYDKEMK